MKSFNTNGKFPEDKAHPRATRDPDAQYPHVISVQDISCVLQAGLCRLDVFTSWPIPWYDRTIRFPKVFQSRICSFSHAKVIKTEHSPVITTTSCDLKYYLGVSEEISARVVKNKQPITFLDNSGPFSMAYIIASEILASKLLVTSSKMEPPFMLAANFSKAVT